ncbi:pirin family protein [Psychrobacter sp. SZ93C1]|uniref:pirin family protein n=1 Tax=Psychrobacter sp. SZ93C1 TaxID=2792058 RepID=UPI0018CE9767|nr:pirin family protein [Psychrobacter sp. SZ93C1]MBH0063878.1 pirin family protein [Psychrobacter sp. SZ93C1]
MRPIENVHSKKAPHWVGDGFYVKTFINHLEENPDFNYEHTDPFLLFDYGEPTTFEPNPNYQTEPHGIGKHPHKGFETVTIAYSGEISHADSTGGCGDILEGDVQWMTAGRGIMHEEFHSAAFGQRGGVFSMVQMWVNLPSADKLTHPKYQSIKRAEIPLVDLIDNSDDSDGSNQATIGKAAIIAGEWQGVTGSASTFTPINVWNIELYASGSTTLQIPNTHNTLLLVQEGELRVNDTPVSAGNLIQFEPPTQHRADIQDEQAPDTDTIELHCPTTTTEGQALTPIKLLLFSGEPIGEPVAGYGPFVMNTQEELRKTFRDYQTGNFIK